MEELKVGFADTLRPKAQSDLVRDLRALCSEVHALTEQLSKQNVALAKLVRMSEFKFELDRLARIQYFSEPLQSPSQFPQAKDLASGHPGE